MRAADVSDWGTLVFEIMSQQTPIARVQPIWLEWMERWPTPEDVAAASSADIIVAWANLGYPSRALRLKACAAAIVEKHGGEVPLSLQELTLLPGVGTYTASARRSWTRTCVVCWSDFWTAESFLPTPRPRKRKRCGPTQFCPKTGTTRPR